MDNWDEWKVTDVAPAAARNSIFDAGNEARYEEVIRREAWRQQTDLPIDQFVPYADVPDVTAGTVDGGFALYRPAQSEIVIDGPLDQYITDSRTVKDEAQHILQPFIHAFLHTELFDATRIAYTRPELEFMEADTVDTRETAVELYNEAVATFQNEYDPGFTAPLLTFGPVHGYRFDPDDYSITVNPDALPEMNVDAFLPEMTSLFITRYDEILQDEVSAAREWAAELYELPLEDVPDCDAYFAELPDEWAADHYPSVNIIRVDFSELPDIDLEQGTFKGDEPLQPQQALDRLLGNCEGGVLQSRSSTVHEVVHEARAANVKAVSEAKANRDSAEEGYGEDRDYVKDIRNASAEASTTFTQFLYGYDGRSAVVQAYGDPWTLPDFFQGYLDIYGPRDRKTIRDPYNLGFFTALTVFDGERRRQESTKAGFDTVRKYLFHEVQTPEEMQETIEEQYEHRPHPNYPNLLKKRYNELQVTDRPLDRMASEMGGVLRDSYRMDADQDTALNWFLDVNAVWEAFHELRDEEPVPTSLQDVYRTAETVRSRYAR